MFRSTPTLLGTDQQAINQTMRPLDLNFLQQGWNIVTSDGSQMVDDTITDWTNADWAFNGWIAEGLKMSDGTDRKNGPVRLQQDGGDIKEGTYKAD